jgi:uncharacterized repeat protein (TIGR01451 family)
MHRASPVRPLRIALIGALLAVLAAAPAHAASVSAVGALDLTVSAPDSPTEGVAFSISAVVTNTTASPTGSFGAVQFFVPTGSQLQGAITNSSGGVCARLGGGGGTGVLVNCPLTSLQPGASATITFSVVPQTFGNLDFQVAAIDGFTITQVDLVVPVAPAPTDVQVTGSASTGSPLFGAQYSYTFQVKDNGPWPAPNVTFADSLPASLTFVGVSSSAGACTQAAGVVTCSFGTLPVGGQANVVITVQAPTTAQTITDTATVAQGATDTQPANNTVNVTVQTK